MSIKWMSFVWSEGPSDRAERFVLLALADFANDDGECWPSVDGIARKTCMTERGCQKIIRRLEETGWLEIDTGLGRRNCNIYRIKNPEPRSPRTTFTPNASAIKGERERKNPEPRSPEPSLTIKEPSVVKIERDEVRSILCEVASPSAVSSFIAYRRKTKGKALTATGAQRLQSGLRTIFDAGGNPDDALAMAEERGWMTVKPDWYFKEIGNGNATGHARPNAPGSGTIDAFAAVAARRQAGSGGN